MTLKEKVEKRSKILTNGKVMTIGVMRTPDGEFIAWNHDRLDWCHENGIEYETEVTPQATVGEACHAVIMEEIDKAIDEMQIEEIAAG